MENEDNKHIINFDNQFDNDEPIELDKEYFCDPLEKSKGFTPLMKAVLCKNREIDDALLQNIDQSNELGWTALIIACRNSNTRSSEEIVRKLIEAKANVNACAVNGWTALMYASYHSKFESSENTVKMLLDAKADTEIAEFSDELTALHIAATYSGRNSTENTVKILLDAEAYVNNRSTDGKTPLMRSVKECNYDSTENTVRMLIEAKSDLYRITDQGNTALSFACSTYSSITGLRILLDAKVDVNFENFEHRTALAMALMCGNCPYEKAKLLIEKGADITKVTQPDAMSRLLRILKKIMEERENEKKVVESLIKHSEPCLNLVISYI
jgi:ankyrin repeat protein